ncbi:tumor necrosis factor a (TNF superfamily, member 2) [Sphaeramia orbicularis]|uniref:Tumor necrosis factor-like n=1 Tax=Sphaeramia orbicularis TaxID=375764 RepID=A0A672Z495_9TELE|nr:tumor necrosis factor-like [Sphaeramia orbicularis]
MEGECLVVVDATLNPQSRNEATQQSVKPSSHSSSSKSKLTTAMLALTLCLASAAAAILFFNNHSNKGLQKEDDFDLRHTLRQISNVRAAIHLEGVYNETLNLLQWKENVDQYHAQGGLTLRDNEIVIPHSGLYFVYSQASFRVKCSISADEGDDDDDGDDDDATSQPMVHLSHTVQRWTSSYGLADDKEYLPILHSVRTACQRTDSNNSDENGRWFSSVYMGAVFNLKKGDQLRAETEQKLLPDLEDEAGNTFFGVFAL